MLHDFSVFDPEDVHGSLAPVLRVQFNMVVDEHQVPVRPQMLDFRGAFWEFFQESGNAFFESLFSIFEPGTVLDIGIARQFVNDGCVMLVEDLVPEIGSQLLVVFELGSSSCCSLWE